MKRIISIIVVTIFLFSQKKLGDNSFGMGLGAQYGGFLGFSIEYELIKNTNIFLSYGDAVFIDEAIYGAGVNYYLNASKSKFRWRLSSSYAVKKLIVYIFSDDDSKIVYAWLTGIGFRLLFWGGFGMDFDYNYALYHIGFDKLTQSEKDAVNEFTFIPSLGFRYRF